MVLWIFLDLIEQFLTEAMFLMVLLWVLKAIFSHVYSALANVLNSKYNW